MSDLKYSMRAAAQRAGLSAHVLRAWERRYRAVQPCRTPTNRRLYSEAEVERLRLLGLATRSGHNIGSVARLPLETLRRMLEASLDGAGVQGAGDGDPARAAANGDNFVARCETALRQLDMDSLESAIQAARVSLGCQGLLCRVLAPLAQTIGALWERGEITAAHEHCASTAMRGVLADLARSSRSDPAAPRLVTATPLGQAHELGAALVGAVAAIHGWRVTCLGASLPAAEIAGAVIQQGARAVALSIVYPQDDPELPGELERLRRWLPVGTAILAGGRAANAYRPALDRIGALVTNDLAAVGELLQPMRAPRAS